MSIRNFIPEVWNASLQEQFEQAAIAAALTNRQFEPDAGVGNKVLITTAIPVEVKDYAAAGRKTSPDAVATTQIALPLDQERAFDFLIDDIDRRQAAGNLDAFTRGAAFGLVDDADRWIFAQIAKAVSVGVKVAQDGKPDKTVKGTAVTGVCDTGEDAWNAIRSLRKALGKKKVPAGGRVLVVNAEFEAALLAHDSKITAADVSGSPQGLREAMLGRILGFDVYTSENLPETEVPFALAFHRSAYGFANQLQKTEAMRADDTFADRLRGLNVYGGVAVRAEAIAAFTATSVPAGTV